MVSVSLKEPNGKTMTYSVSDIVTSVINSGTTDAMQKLLENGIVERKEFHAVRPLYYATSQGKTEIVKTMLDNPIMQESLRQEIHIPEPSNLQMAAAHNNQEVINAIL